MRKTNVKVSMEARIEIESGFLGLLMKSLNESQSKQSTSGSTVKDCQMPEGTAVKHGWTFKGQEEEDKTSFEARNRRAFWKLLHPRKSSGGSWLIFEGPSSLQGICDARWVQDQVRHGGFYKVPLCNNNYKWCWDAEKVFGRMTV